MKNNGGLIDAAISYRMISASCHPAGADEQCSDSPGRSRRSLPNMRKVAASMRRRALSATSAYMLQPGDMSTEGAMLENVRLCKGEASEISDFETSEVNDA